MVQQYDKSKTANPKLLDYQIAKMMGISQSTLSKLKTKFYTPKFEQPIIFLNSNSQQGSLNTIKKHKIIKK